MADSKPDHEIQILIVDDDKVDRRAVQRALPQGFVAAEAENCQQAAALLKEQTIDCVLLDYDIPGSNTLQFLADVSQQIPVAVLTGRGDEAISVAVMKAGALDYMNKSAICKETLERMILQAIDKARHQEESRLARERLRTLYQHEKQKRQELEVALRVARDIQHYLIPSSPPSLEGFDIAGICRPTEVASGDFFDYVPLLDGMWSIVVGDVSGHGIAAALLAMEVRAHLRALAEVHADLGQMLTISNRLLFDDTTSDRFATLFWAKLNAREKSLQYASAGHRAFIARSTGATVILDGTALPLGLEPKMQVPNGKSYSLTTGDVVLLMTDGLYESMSPDKQLFGTDRCLEIVRRCRTDPAERIVDQLLLVAREFARGEPQHDDIAIVVIRVL